MIHWFLYVTGVTDVTWYNWWSGFFADIIIFTAGGAWYYRHICHVDGCYRLGLHKVEGTPYTTCRKHTPDMKPRGQVSLKHIHALHKKYQSK